VNRASFAVQRCPDWFVRGAIEECHYLHRWPDPRSEPFGYCLSLDGQTSAADGRPFGAVVFKLLQHKRQQGLFGYPGLPTQWQVLDLARVWIHPDLQAYAWMGTDRSGRLRLMDLNAFSRMTSAAIRRVQRDWLEWHGVRYLDEPYHIELIVSYCDRTHHQGTGYKAAGFTLWGETSDGSKDVYIRRLKRPRWEYMPPQPALLEAAG
jgi:hypothetical protein